MGKYSILTDDQRRELDSFSFGKFFMGPVGGRRKRRLFSAIDEGRRGLKKLKVNDDDGRAVAAIAGAYATSIGLIDWVVRKKTEELSNPADRRRALELFGGYAAEAYFRDRKIGASDQPSLLAITVSASELSELLRAMVDAGIVAAGEEVAAPDTATMDEAVELLIEALSRYDDAIPLVDEDGSVPTRTQDVGIAKAAFMGLRAEALRDLSEGDKDELEATAKEHLAARLAEEYAGREQEIADLVRAEMTGTKDAVRLVTRLVPLAEAPEGLQDSAERLVQLKDRFFETRPAEWFCFRDVRRVGSTLTIVGELSGYSVHVDEVKADARLLPRRFKETVRIVLRDGIDWVETNAPRAGSLTAIRRMLRRTELAVPKAALSSPSPIRKRPYSRADPRSLWFLELLYRELSSDPFRVHDHLLVNFERPTRDKDGDGPEVHEHRLKGRKLINHPDVCNLILNSRGIIDLDLRVRVKQPRTDQRLWPSMRLKLSRAPDHLAVTSFELAGELNPILHRNLVGKIRDAAIRPIGTKYIELPMKAVVANAAKAETAADLETVVGQEDAPASA